MYFSCEGMSDSAKSGIVLHVVGRFSGWSERKDIDCPSVQLWLCSQFILLRLQIVSGIVIWHKYGNASLLLWDSLICPVFANKDTWLFYDTMLKE